MEEPGSTRSKGATPVTLRLLLALGFVVAVGATVLAVLSEDARILRLAVVLALWAALIAAFAVTRSRRDAKAAALRESEAQLAYQLELHREVAARHEYEADLSARMAAAQSEQIAELREQLDRLTEVLSSLADGELLVSRLTVSAESARFRAGQAVMAPPTAVPLPEGGRAVLAGAPQVSIVDVAAAAPAPVTAARDADAGPPAAPSVVEEAGVEGAGTEVATSEETGDARAEITAPAEIAAGEATFGPVPAPETALAPAARDGDAAGPPAAAPVVEGPGVEGAGTEVAASEEAGDARAEITAPAEIAAGEATFGPVVAPEKAAIEPPSAELDRPRDAEPTVEATAESAAEATPPPAARPSRHAAPDDAERPAAARPAPDRVESATPGTPSYSMPAFVTPQPSAPDDTVAPPVSVPERQEESTPSVEGTEAVSVDELLAAYGLTGSPRRRRRE